MGFPLIAVPFIILFQTAFSIGLAYTVAALNVFFSDVKHLLEIFLQVWFWLTPIIYPANFVPEKYQFLYRLNPAVLFVESYRNCLLYNKMPSLSSLLILFITGTAALFIGQLVFNYYNKRFAEEI
jgi:ABC-type polysaccharide/polyol phosphate export permease